MPYLMIENPVKSVPSVELMRMLGASASRGQESKIGQFGSGFPYSLALLARHGLLQGTKICLGTDVYTFEIEEHNVKDASGRSCVQHEIRMRKQNGGSWDLNISTEFGALDWRDVTLAVREFVSNAVDGVVEYGGVPHKDVTVRADIPDEGRMTRAKEGFIRVYIPINDDIQDYVDNLHKYFRCLSPGYFPDRKILLNLDGGPARIYRKGVLVGTFGEHSLFHYNVNDIPINESRLVDSWTARSHCGTTIASCGTTSIISKFLSHKLNPKEDYFENDIYLRDMLTSNMYGISDETKESIKQTMTQAVKDVVKGKIVCASKIAARMVEGKGLEVLPVDESLASLLAHYGAKTSEHVLNRDEMEGRVFSAPTQAAQDMRDKVWNLLTRHNLTMGKPMPRVGCFTQHMTEGGMLGYCRHGEDIVYIRSDIADGVNTHSMQTMVEEIAHYVTGSQDCTREFQEFAFKIVAMIALA